MKTPYKLVRDMTSGEGGAYFDEVLKTSHLEAGTTVYNFTGPTYGVVGEFAATLNQDGSGPFFELPYDGIVDA